jgi:hypothetical protein
VYEETLLIYSKVSTTHSGASPGVIHCNFLNIRVLYNISDAYITPWSWAVLERPQIVELLKEFPAYYGT